MVGRAPRKQRRKASDQNSRSQESRVPSSATLHQPGPESGSSSQPPQPSVSASITEESAPAVNNTMAEVTGVSTETEINSYLLNLSSDYPDLPLVSPGATDPFWLATENLLTDPRPDIHGISTSEGMPDKHITELHAPKRTAESVRSRLAEHTDARVPPSYRDPSVVSDYPHTAGLMKMIESLEEQLQIPWVPIDRAMRLNRQAMVKVREVSKTDEFRRCQSCPLLVATILDLVVGLYELVLLSIQRPASEGETVSLVDQNNPPWPQNPFQQPARTGEMPSVGSSPGSAVSGGSGPPLFRFGCLEFDPDEQEIFRAAMVRRDLRRCVETILYCSQEILRQRQAANLRGGPLNGVFQSRSPSNQVHTQWYQEMGYRAKELLAALPTQCSYRERT
ncbi:hypothetical protein PITC_099800 [Penicillium italicum]|uniref:Uncharacterized protein n=1 Tax=Penicillium italicum TaxID=40296 RepID=A0A0A2L381_PENIT|nr:hypothetical protein PITC_099800 [Penicillium italicum]